MNYEIGLEQFGDRLANVMASTCVRQKFKSIAYGRFVVLINWILLYLDRVLMTCPQRLYQIKPRIQAIAGMIVCGAGGRYPSAL